MGGTGFQIIILLIIAVVLLVRLIGSLGKRDGYEPSPEIQARPTQKPDLKLVDNTEDFDIEQFAEGDDNIAEALRQAKSVEPAFRIGDFLNGSKRAYEMILMGFLNGKVDEVKPFVEKHVYDGFVEAIKDREDRGEEIEASFIGIRNVELKSAYFDESSKELTLGVEYVSELSRVVKDKDGKIIEGKKDKVESEVDYWQFARAMNDDNPNWLLVATGE